MQLSESEPDIDSVRTSILRSYDGTPRDERQRSIGSVATIDSYSPELDGTFIPHQDRWMDFQGFPTHQTHTSNFGGFVCSSVFGV